MKKHCTREQGHCIWLLSPFYLLVAFCSQMNIAHSLKKATHSALSICPLIIQPTEGRDCIWCGYQASQRLSDSSKEVAQSGLKCSPVFPVALNKLFWVLHWAVASKWHTILAKCFAYSRHRCLIAKWKARVHYQNSPVELVGSSELCLLVLWLLCQVAAPRIMHMVAHSEPQFIHSFSFQGVKWDANFIWNYI